MNPVRRLTVGNFFLGIIIVCYPVIVYTLLDKVGPSTLGIVLVLLLLLRALIFSKYAPSAAWGLIAIGAIAIGLFFSDLSASVLILYPSLMNFGLLCAFAYTLIRPPSMIERFARATEDTPSIKVGPYTRVVTMVWCVFFAINTVITALVAIRGSLGFWTLYNGLISYLIVAVLIIGELVVRHFYKKRHGIDGGHSTIADKLSAKRVPSPAERHAGDESVELLLPIDGDLAWFEGHFPGDPILPAVVQIDWAIHFGAELGFRRRQFSGMERLKFRAVIAPGTPVRLTLNRSDQSLAFRYESSQGIHSQGKIRFDPSPATI